jgi:hypothetical protein
MRLGQHNTINIIHGLARDHVVGLVPVRAEKKYRTFYHFEAKFIVTARTFYCEGRGQI